MIVHPRCKNTIAELSVYCWDTKRDDPVNKPVDKDNHLMDALRYAMEDVRFFKPRNAAEDKKKRVWRPPYGSSGGISADDFKGGWDG